MLIVLANQDSLSGNDSWKEQVVDNTLAFYESGQEDLDNRVGLYTITSYRSPVLIGTFPGTKRRHMVPIIPLLCAG